MMAYPFNQKQFWREFLQLYHDLPELWKVKSDSYKDRNLKTAGYNKLVEKMKQIDPNADRDSVRRKINGLRTSYRRELKKVSDSLKSGKDDVYVPSLWYFDEIDFLREQEIQVPGSSPTDDDTIENDETVPEVITEIYTSTPHNVFTQERKLGVKRRMTTNHETYEPKRNQLLDLACERLITLNSEAEIVATNWALDYIKLRPDQQIYAKKAINDILFEAQLGTLHRHSVTIHQPPESCPTSSNYLNSNQHSTYLLSSYTSPQHNEDLSNHSHFTSSSNITDKKVPYTVCTNNVDHDDSS